jgi:hypothetical protein
MSTSIIKAGLDDLAQEIRTERQAATTAIARLTTAYNNLQALTTKYADLVGMIDGLGTDPSDEVYKDEKTKLQAEFVGLRNEINTINTAITDTGIVL